MNTLLFQSISGITALIVFIAWVRPQTFKFLLDKDSIYPSLGRQGQFTALLVSTWVLVAEAITSHISEWLFTGYMFAWATAQFSSAWLKIKGQSGATEPGAQK